MTSLDSDVARLQRVQSNLDRLHLHANLVVGDAASPSWWDGVAFDRILADVPCTASGIVRRHVDIKWLRREADISSFAAQQAKKSIERIDNTGAVREQITSFKFLALT